MEPDKHIIVTYKNLFVIINNYFFIVGLLLCFIINSLSQQDCNFNAHLDINKTYYVYNPDYPKASNGQQFCKWNATSDYRVKLTCKTFNIPSDDCYYNRLTIYVNESMSLFYCGNKTFSVESTGNFMIIEFSTAYWASRTKFLCKLQALQEIKEEIKQDNCRCGWKKPTKIVGGVETGVNEYPMMAALVDATRKDVYCGASIISAKYILSAAHCVTNRNTNNTGVLVGDHDLSTGVDTNAAKLYPVSKFHIHPLYNSTSQENDIAVIKVKSDINFSIEVGPVCLPFQHRCDSFAGNYVDLLGWGTTRFGGSKSDTLLKVTLSVLTNKKCRQSYPNLSNKQLCTYEMGEDACQFDSGGPVLWQNPTTRREVLVGIIASGIGCAGKMPGINTRVNMYMDWILKITAGTTYCEEE